MKRMTRSDRRSVASSLLVTAVLLSPLGCGPSASDEPLSGATIVIRHDEIFGDLQRPAVPFDHGRHTEVLEGEDCGTCHTQITEGEAPYAFVPAGITDATAAMDHFHDRCIGCHEERRKAGDEEPPVTCGDCHTRGVEQRAAEHVGADWDYAVHSKHVVGLNQECEACHHVLDETAGKLVYAEGHEGACQDCHGAVADGDTPSLRTAAHEQCVQCHLTRGQQGQAAGPTACDACHAEREPVDAATLAILPRLERGQPDTIDIELDGGRLSAVTFDHKGHESRAQFCRDCHHESMESCHECHTLGGDEEGAGVTAQMAFHAPGSEASCVGCHDAETRKPGCAGCHQLMPASMPRESCAICHTRDTAAELVSAEANSGGAVDHASAFKADAPRLAPTAILGDAPEQVTLDGLVADYSAVTYPHQQVYEALRDTAAGSELAKSFHGSDETLCYGCHHNSPAGQTPPACGTCHERTTFDDRTPGRPGLMAAYHLQCLGCHQTMEIEPQSCAKGCHTPATGPAKESGKVEETR